MSFQKADAFPPQFEDANGDPLALGTIEFYVWNTTTPTPIYFDVNGSASATSITLNLLGQPSNGGDAVDLFYSSAITYKIIRKDAAGTEISPVLGPFYTSIAAADLAGTGSASTGAGLVGFNGNNAYPSGTVGYSLLYSRPTVQMIKTALGVFKVFRPNGTEVDISASTTDGLQEAISEACINGWDLYVAGGGVTSAGVYQSAITCTTGIVFPPMQTRNIVIGSVSIEFSAAVTGDAVLIDSSMMVNVQWGGQIVYQGNTTPMRFKTVNNVPLDGVKVIDVCTFSLPTIVTVGGTNPDGVIFESVDGAIQRSTFIFPENNGADFTTVYGRHGFVIKDPSGVGSGFIGNMIISKGVHRYSGSSLKVGETTAAATSVYGNTYDLCIMPDGASSIGVQTYAKNDNFILSLLNNEGTIATGISLETSASRNTFKVLKNDGVIPVADSSTLQDNTGMYGDFLPRASVTRNGVNQTGIVTATWTRVEFTTEVYDLCGKFDPATNFRWTPQKLGQARISARVGWATIADASAIRIAVYKNGVLYKAVLASSSGTLTGQGPMISVGVPVDAITDYFDIYARQETGGNRDIDGAISDTWAMFEMLP
jgi:hypothetical protein